MTPGHTADLPSEDLRVPVSVSPTCTFLVGFHTQGFLGKNRECLLIRWLGAESESRVEMAAIWFSF